MREKSSLCCQECLKKVRYFDTAWSSCLYQEPLKTLIHQFKYGQKTLLRQIFCHWMKKFIENYHIDIHAFDVLVPIPLSSTRLRERGFNQAELLAQGLAKEFNIGISRHNLIRIKHTPHLAALNEKERWTKIQGAFRIKYPSLFKNLKTLLIDDLLTTGATASEAAFVLKEAGAKTIGLLTLAIA